FGLADNLVPNVQSEGAVPEVASWVYLVCGLVPLCLLYRRSVRWSRRPCIHALTVALAVTSWLIAPAIVLLPASPPHALDRGHAILQQRGLQIQAALSPSLAYPDIDQNVFAQSRFTGLFILQNDRSIPLAKHLGPAPGIPSGLQLSYGYLNSVEQPYL